jgi:plastocyanin
MLVLGAGLREGDAQTEGTVHIVDHAFVPTLVGVQVGATVTWTNTGNEPHTVTADNSSFSSGRLAPGESFSHTFDTIGSFTYRCRIHPSMTGTVVVTAAGGAAEGGVNPETTPPGVGVGILAVEHTLDVALLAGVTSLLLGVAALALRRV